MWFALCDVWFAELEAAWAIWGAKFKGVNAIALASCKVQAVILEKVGDIMFEQDVPIVETDPRGSCWAWENRVAVLNVELVERIVLADGDRVPLHFGDAKGIVRKSLSCAYDVPLGFVEWLLMDSRDVPIWR